MIFSRDPVWINSRGGIVINNKIVADGFESVRLRFLSHAHSDHTIDLSLSIKNQQIIYAHKATFEILDALDEYIPRYARKSLEYGDKVYLDEDYLEIIEAKHILGSIQLVYHSPNKGVIVYTGDFKKPGKGTKIVEGADIVVTEATYGDPEYVRRFKDVAEEALVDFITHLLSRGPVYLFAYYGKQQEVMDLLRRGGVVAPFIAPEKIYRLSKIAEKYGMMIKDLLHENSREAEEIFRDGWFVYFAHPAYGSRYVNRRNMINSSLKPSSVHLSGWLFDSLYKSIDERSYIFSFSDHADFHELIDYVDMTRPKMVIIDSFRSGETGKKFAKEIKRRLNIEAVTQPI
ncbi:MAG: MBL fold metallo-hydrolase [Sulfolobales archaeon]